MSIAFSHADVDGHLCENARVSPNPDPDQEAARQTVRNLMDATGLDATGLARLAGVAPSTLTRLMAGSVKYTLSARTLAKVQRAAAIKVQGISRALPILNATMPGTKHLDRQQPESLSIPELDVRAMGGAGAEDTDIEGDDGQHPVLGEWTLPMEYLKAYTPSPGAVRIIRVVGDSMEPHYPAGDRVLVDTSHRLPSPPGVYVIWDGFALILKHAEVLVGRSPPMVRLSSENPFYAPYEVPVNDLTVQGRVMGKWVWK